MNQDLPLLLRIQRACTAIQEYAGDNEHIFMGSPLHQEAVLYNLIIIGEAAKRLSAPGGAEAQQSLGQAARTRDRLAHEIFEIRLSSIWRTATVDVPQLLEEIDALLSTG